MAKEKDPRLKRAGVTGYNKPKRTPNHPTKSHVVVAKVGDKVKTIRFGQQGVRGAGKNPKSKKDKARRSADRKKGPMFRLPGPDISAAVREISKKSYNKGDFVEVPVKLARTNPTRIY